MVGKAVEIKERMQKTSAFFGSSLEYQQDLKQALISPLPILFQYSKHSTANSTAPAFISAKMFSPIVNNCPLEISPSPPEEWG